MPTWRAQRQLYLLKLPYLGVDGRIILEIDLQEVGWTGLIWLRIGTGGGLL
jgi:hypothetical protein